MFSLDFADGDKTEIGEILEDIIGDVARTGQYMYVMKHLFQLSEYYLVFTI